MTNGRDQRKIKNFLLQPLLQVKLGIYSILLSVAFSGMLVALLYFKLNRFYHFVLELTNKRDDVTFLLNAYVAELSWWVAGCIAVFLVANVVISIVYTHRLVGPTYAFRRHTQDLTKGKYTSRVVLRKGDAFKELADDLNHLAEALDGSAGKRRVS